MRSLAVLLQLGGLIITFSIGVVGYVLGPLMILSGSILYRRATKELQQVKDLEKALPEEQLANIKAKKRKRLLIALPVIACLIVTGIVFSVSSMKSSDAYKIGLSQAKQSEAFISAIGQPSDEGFMVMGTIENQGVMGTAKLSVPVEGPKGRGELYIEASKAAGTWAVVELLLIQEDPNSPIKLK